MVTPRGRIKTLGTVIAVSLMFAMGGCGKSQNVPDGGGAASVRVIHAAPTVGALDIFVQGQNTPIITGLAYGQSSNYVALGAGTYTFVVRAATPNHNGAVLFTSAPVSIAQGARVTAVAAGRLNQTGTQAFRITPYQESFAIPASGTARVRVVNSSPDAGTIAVDIGADGTIDIPNLAVYAASDPAGIEVPAGTALPIALIDTTTQQTIAVFTQPAFASGDQCFLVVSGFTQPPLSTAAALTLVPVTQSGALPLVAVNPSMFLLDGIPDAPAVDVYAGNTLIASNLSFSQISAAATFLPQQGAQLTVVPTGQTPDKAIGTMNVPQLQAGVRYLGTMTGYVNPPQGAPALQLVDAPDDFAIDLQNASVKFIHAAPDVPAIDVGPVVNGQVTPPLLAQNISFGQFQPARGGATLPPGMLVTGAAPTGQTTPIATFNVTSVAGAQVFAVAIGLANPGQNQQPLVLDLVNATTLPWTATAVPPNPPPN